jgi:hypothetical protein
MGGLREGGGEGGDLGWHRRRDVVAAALRVRRLPVRAEPSAAGLSGELVVADGCLRGGRDENGGLFDQYLASI